MPFLLAVAAYFWFFILMSLVFLFNLVLLCSHHATKHTTQLLGKSQSFPVFCCLMLIVAHKTTNRFIIWRRVCERTVVAHNIMLTMDAWIESHVFFPPFKMCCYTSIIQLCLFLSNLSIFFIPTFFGYKCSSSLHKTSEEKWRKQNRTTIVIMAVANWTVLVGRHQPFFISTHKQSYKCLNK